MPAITFDDYCKIRPDQRVWVPTKVAHGTERVTWGRRLLFLLVLLAIVIWLWFVAWLVSLLLRLVQRLVAGA